MRAEAINCLVGWSAGYQYCDFKTRENEAKQGKNYYISTALQASQLSTLGVIFQRVAALMPRNGFTRAAPILGNVVPLLALPLCIFTGIVKQGDYSKFAKYWNSSTKLPGTLPEKLSNRAIKIINFFAEHTGDIARIAMLVGSIALIAMGSTFFGGAVLTALTYEAIDTMGWVPRKISLFMEKYMSKVALVGLLIGGSLFMQIYAACTLPTAIPKLNRFLLHKIDRLANSFLKLKFPLYSGYNLEEIDAPVKERKNMTFAEINEVLDCTKTRYEINPAHFSKWSQDPSKMPENRRFGEMLTLFNKIDWSKKYSLVSKKLADDERFIDSLKTQFPNVTKEVFRRDIDIYLGKLAAAQKMTKEAYAAKWLKTQMVTLVDTLQGKTRAKGWQVDLDDALSNCGKILSYMQKLNPTTDRIELEDLLLKLACEGGDYCARGIKRASSEMVNQICNKKSTAYDPTKDYERQLYQQLYEQRSELLQQAYNLIVDQILGIYPDAVKQDVHAFDLYRVYLSLGFIPLTDHEREKIGLGHLISWRLYGALRNQLHNEYDPNKSVKKIGELHFATYMRSLILNNKALTETQKEQILEKYTERNDGKWTVAETDFNFHRLMFVMLGIMHKVES